MARNNDPKNDPQSGKPGDPPPTKKEGADPSGTGQAPTAQAGVAQQASQTSTSQPTAPLEGAPLTPDQLAGLTPVKVEGTFAFRPPNQGNPDTTPLWQSIRTHTQQISFNEFERFVERALGSGLPPDQNRLNGSGELSMLQQRLQARADLTTNGSACQPLGQFGGFIPGTDLYGILKLAAEIFLLLRCGICHTGGGETSQSDVPPAGRNIFGITNDAPTPAQLQTLATTLTPFLTADRGSYVRGIVENVFRDNSFEASPFSPLSVGFGPCLLELIWNYWHEEGMLVQTSTAIALRFQNVARNGRDPLAELEIDSLRPLGGFLWGYIQDEPSRLSVARRAYEYQHHYGISLFGKATSRLRTADSRSRFLASFHDLLRLADNFYREASDNTVTPDPFPLLVALRDLHLILAEGAHNQFRDMPWTARAEMLVQQWLLARSEMRDFLRGRLMVPYPERWMGAVDAMKRLQGWSDTNVTHFRDLAVNGERILLSIRHVAWDRITDPQAAQDWALFWRPEIQSYVHAYRIATGVALSDDVVEISQLDSPRYVQPAMLLRDRLSDQRRNALPAGQRGAGVRPEARTGVLVRRPRS